MNDPHDGQGGSYVLDPETGDKTLVERTEAQPTEPAAAGFFIPEGKRAEGSNPFGTPAEPASPAIGTTEEQ